MISSPPRSSMPRTTVLFSRLRPLAALGFAADQRLVDLDDLAGAANGSLPSSLRHVFPDLVAHAPSRLVRHANLALDSLGSNAVPRRREQEDHIVPVAKAGPGVVERRSGGRIELMGAPLALVGAASPSRGCSSSRAAHTRGSSKSVAVANLKQVLEAAILSREAVLKLAERRGFRVHAHYLAHLPYMSQGDKFLTARCSSKRHGPVEYRPARNRRASFSNHAILANPAGVIASLAIYFHSLMWWTEPRDMPLFQGPWFEHIVHYGPVGAFAHPFSNYTPAYLYLLAIVSLFHGSMDAMYLVKLLSVAGTAFAALAVAILSRPQAGNHDTPCCCSSCPRR